MRNSAAIRFILHKDDSGLDEAVTTIGEMKTFLGVFTKRERFIFVGDAVACADDVVVVTFFVVVS